MGHKVFAKEFVLPNVVLDAPTLEHKVANVTAFMVMMCLYFVSL
jgi:hypothetical protein